MKYVFLAIFVLLAMQPMQASSCDMQKSQEMSHAGHDSMQDSHHSEMDCCDQDPSVPADHCNSMSHCGACPTAVIALNASNANMIFSTGARLYLPDTGVLLCTSSSPPFRPPIS